MYSFIYLNSQLTFPAEGMRQGPPRVPLGRTQRTEFDLILLKQAQLCRHFSNKAKYYEASKNRTCFRGTWPTLLHAMEPSASKATTLSCLNILVVVYWLSKLFLNSFYSLLCARNAVDSLVNLYSVHTQTDLFV
jgi:hypothetical protein